MATAFLGSPLGLAPAAGEAIKKVAIFANFANTGFSDPSIPPQSAGGG